MAARSSSAQAIWTIASSELIAPTSSRMIPMAEFETAT